MQDTQALIEQKGLHATGKGPAGLDQVKAALAKLPPPPAPKGAPQQGPQGK